MLDHVTIKGSTGAGLVMRAGATFLPGSAELVVTGSDSALSPYPVRIEEHSMDALPTGTFTGNKTDEISLVLYGDGVAGDGLTVDATLHDRGVPYRVDGNFGIGHIGMGLATMTIEPGVTMKFAANKSFSIQKFTGDTPSGAALVAVGTAAKPIVFTSASPTPAAGDCITNSTVLASAGHGITEGFGGDLVDFRPTNTFTAVAGCAQTLPKVKAPKSCAMPLLACDGL